MSQLNIYESGLNSFMMILEFLLLSLVFLCVLLVQGSSPSLVKAFAGLAVDHGRRFESKIRQVTVLRPYRFNGGYDPSSPLEWTPQQAAEFTIFHEGTPQHAGMQLRTAIQHWSGADVAEFLSRLYLGHKVTNKKNTSVVHKSSKTIVYEPQNVRTPQWEGLNTREGVVALKDLLKEALSKESLSAQEISRFAEEFLLKEYRWPTRVQHSKSTSSSRSFSNSQVGEIVFEEDSFYSLGHARTIARVLLTVRKERGYAEFNWNEIASMVTLPEKMDEDREATPMEMIEFLRTISGYTTLTATDKANIVQRMAISGWLSGSIPKFLAELLPTETMSENHYGLRRDMFFDFPVASTVFESNVNEENKNSAQTDFAIAKIAKVIGKDSTLLSSQRLHSSKEITRSEYEELVQSYWKKVELSTSQKKKQDVNGYGVPKTKSIKKRKIPKKGYGVPKLKSVVDSIST